MIKSWLEPAEVEEATYYFPELPWLNWAIPLVLGAVVVILLFVWKRGRSRDRL